MIRAKAAGSVRDNLKLDMLKEMTIPDSSLDDQRHCVATLDNLQYLIELRKSNSTNWTTSSKLDLSSYLVIRAIMKNHYLI